jgi:Na+-transporting methylmalonyl-CoA/oxaloacetate decarboxylase gamma subunit
MGSLGGHLVPGTIFIIIGLWWIYSAWLRYFVCRRRRQPFYVTTSFPCHCCGTRTIKLPIEAFFVLFGTSLGILIELIGGFNRTVDPSTHHMSFYEGANNLQHFAMYSMFFLVGIIELCVHYELPLPKHIDGVAGCLAFISEALLFYFHGHTRDPVEVQLHVFLVLAILGTVVCGITEILQQDKQVYPTLMRAYFTVLQGSWFYTTGFLLYDPFHGHYDASEDPDPHRTLMLVAYYFVLHMGVILALLLLLAVLAYRTSQRQHDTLDFVEYGQLVIDDGDEMDKLTHTTDI